MASPLERICTPKSATCNSSQGCYQCVTRRQKAAPISKRSIAAAKPGDVLRDTVVKGLHLRVSITRKAFYLFYRAPDGTQRRPKLGDHPTIELAQARSAARELLTHVAAGHDPVTERRNARQSPTMAEICARYLKHIEHDPRARKKPRSIYEDSRLIERHILPAMGPRKVQAIDREDVEALHSSLSETPYQANRVLALESRIFNLAEKWRHRSAGTNPCRHVDRYAERKRRRYMTREEAPRIAAALKHHEATHPRAVLFVYLLILSGARPDEISRARWEWIEPVGDGGVLRLPDSKTGARPVYLPPQVMQLLERTPRTGETLTGIKSPKAVWNKVRIEAGVPDLRLYDMRHTFASAALALGHSLAQIGELLGHADTKTTQRYAHLMEDSAHAVAETTAGLIEHMLAAHT